MRFVEISYKAELEQNEKLYFFNFKDIESVTFYQYSKGYVDIEFKNKKLFGHLDLIDLMKLQDFIKPTRTKNDYLKLTLYEDYSSEELNLTVNNCKKEDINSFKED